MHVHAQLAACGRPQSNCQQLVARQVAACRGTWFKHDVWFVPPAPAGSEDSGEIEAKSPSFRSGNTRIARATSHVFALFDQSPPRRASGRRSLGAAPDCGAGNWCHSGRCPRSELGGVLRSSVTIFVAEAPSTKSSGSSFGAGGVPNITGPELSRALLPKDKLASVEHRIRWCLSAPTYCLQVQKHRKNPSD